MFGPKPVWRKCGLVVVPNPQLWWWQTHAMLPTPEMLSPSLCRIYFSGRNSKNQSHIGWVEIDLREPTKITRYCTEPVLGPGELGCFDDNGVTPSSVLHHAGKVFLYYIGWTPGSTVRMNLFGGLALSHDSGKTFKRHSEAPVIERCKVNPYLNTAPMVIREGNVWRMYYVAGTEWRHRDLPRYNIQYAESNDGVHWNRTGHVAIPFRNEEENALARPFVLREDGVYRMWFSHKSGEDGFYRMGYAESLDGVSWIRDDGYGGLDVSENGFDSEMIAYFCVVRFEEKRFLFYNGNGYGRDGIGLAVEV